MKAKWIALVMALLFVVAPVLAGVASAQQQPVTIKIGALLPLTGDLQSYGERAQAAVEFAVQEMNQYLKEKNAWFRLQLIVEDTQTKPDVAVQKFSSLVAQGVKFIVGPMTSAEVKKVRGPADQQNVLIISPSSTAIELAIPGDNVFRFCPADNVQSKAIGALAQKLGLKAVVIINRADTWGNGLRDATKKVLESEGIKVEKIYSYNAESPAFSSIATNLNDELGNLLKEYKPNEVAVVLIAFNEAKDLFVEARKYPNPSKVVWIGSDGTALLTEIVDDPVSGAFAAETLFINPIFSPAATQEQAKVAQYVKQKLGVEPDAYALAAHDAVVALTLAILKAGPTSDMDALVNKVKQLIPQITQSDEFAKYAATGKFPLNKAGDRATADYDLWIVMKNESNGKYAWVKAGKYKGLENKIEFIKLPNGKTYLDLFNEKFAPATSTANAKTSSPSTAASAKAGGKGGSNAALIAGIIILIIIIIGAVYVAKK
ncbi:MAG: penicillin-binding protein activator [Desulfurococcales archaeon]|nr:penicillin-binding protein activator [Desulfurococcales archaeon]